MSTKTQGAQYIPIEFQLQHPFRYPAHNKIEFERWFKDNYKAQDSVISERQYLPILWTSYWCAHKYGKDQSAVNKLKLFIDSIDRSKKYYTICQYDDGPMIDLSHLDIIVCGMSGGRIDYPLPLICEEHEHRFAKQKRNILASFYGANTHVIREAIVKQFAYAPNCFASFQKIRPIDFCLNMSKSLFALCPRGYGKSSFRIQEAIEYGAIPVYVSDEFVFPYDEGFEYGIVINTKSQPEAFEKMYDYLLSISQNTEMVQMLQSKVSASRRFFTYDGCKNKILDYISKHS